MKKFTQDSSSALSRFSRDKRTRTSSAEKIERSPRPRREADNEGRSTRGGRSTETRRASYNPNFSADNRPNFREERSFGEEKRSFGNRTERSSRGEFSPRAERTERTARGGSKPSFKSEGRSNSGFKSEGRGFKSEGRGFKSENRGGFKSEERGYKSENRGGFKSEERGGFKGGKKSFRQEEGQRNYPKYSAKQPGQMRLNRFLAQSGLCSRREADDFITAGLVTVNGVIVTELGTKVSSSDEVKFNDSKVQGEKKVYLILNKPKGYVTSLEDPHADKTVMELVKNACSERIYPVGRLDKNSLGLLLFTNDGDITRQLTHPSLEKKKVYQVTLDKPLTRADMEQITEGITLEDGEIYADEIAYVGDSKKEVGIEIHSGRNRIVRRIFEHLGYTVQKLDRVYYAGITKKNLKRGAWRFLTNDEVNRLKSGRYE